MLSPGKPLRSGGSGHDGGSNDLVDNCWVGKISIRKAKMWSGMVHRGPGKAVGICKLELKKWG